MKSRIIKDDFKGLGKLVGSIKKGYAIRVGIFGDKTSRDDGTLTNAELGAIHEFGSYSRGIPMRSFLRMPLGTKTKQIAKEGKAGMTAALARGDFMKVLQNFAIACHGAVTDAFATSGFGTWAPDSKKTIARKKSATPLIDTGQLARAIDWQVVQK
jgi:phage gpG-like protein